MLSATINSLCSMAEGGVVFRVFLITTGCPGQPEHCALHYPWCALHYACPSCALHSALPPWSTVLCTATPLGVVLYTAPRRIGLCTDTLCHCALHCPFSEHRIYACGLTCSTQSLRSALSFQGFTMHCPFFGETLTIFHCLF